MHLTHLDLFLWTDCVFSWVYLKIPPGTILTYINIHLVSLVFIKTMYELLILRFAIPK